MTNFGRLRRYLAVPFRSAERIRRDVDDELAMHIALRAEALVREGMTPAEARARATREFGDIDDAARYCTAVDHKAERRRRATGWLAELAQDVRHLEAGVAKVLPDNRVAVVALLQSGAIAMVDIEERRVLSRHDIGRRLDAAAWGPTP